MTTPSFAEILEASTERCRKMDAPLDKRLQSFADDVRSLSPQFALIVDAMVKRLTESGAGISTPAIGELMPSFLLPDESGHLVSLDQMLENGPVVVAMHRGHWCPYCRINASALTAIHSEASTFSGQIVAITPELQEYTARFKADARAPYPILTDLDNAFALELNLAIWVGQEMKNAMTSAGWDISPFNGNDTWLLPIPATFVVGQDGFVRARFVDPDYRKRMDIADILDGLKQASE